MSETSRPPAWPRALVAAITCAGALGLLLHSTHFDHFADDAYISLRYVDNWLRGEGLVFNPGERVMGYSNFAWVVAMTGLGGLGLPLVGAAKISGLLLSLACLAIVCRELTRRHDGWMPAAAAALWLAASGPFALWAGAGLEGPLFALALLIATLGAERIADAPSPEAARRPVLAVGIALAVATWTRPEGAGYAVALAAWLAWRARHSAPAAGGFARWHPALVCFGSGALAWLALAAFAQAYYGDPLPNTYYAKTHPLSGAVLERFAVYTRAYLSAHYYAPAWVLLAFVVSHVRVPRARGWAALVVLLAFAVYYARIGGDALVYYRMWAWTQPLFALLLGDAVASFQRSPRARPLAFAAFALPLLCLPNSFRGFEIDYLRADDARIRSLAALGAELRDLPEDTKLATNVIGALGFESRLYVVDMLGLTDAHIARAAGKALGTPGHESHDGAYVLDREPDLLFVGIPRASEEAIGVQLAFQPNFPSDRDLANDPRLRNDYTFQHLQLPEPDGRLVAVFVRRAYSGLGAGAGGDSGNRGDSGGAGGLGGLGGLGGSSPTR